MTRFYILFVLIALLPACKTNEKRQSKPKLYIIGDSTVKNGQGDGSGGLWGWGDPIVQYFDTSRINIENHARGGHQ